MRMTAHAFDHLCQLARLQPGSLATTAARRVLVAGESAADVARDMGVHGGTVQNAVTHARQMARLAAAVATGIVDTPATAARRGRKPQPRQRDASAGGALPPAA